MFDEGGTGRVWSTKTKTGHHGAGKLSCACASRVWKLDTLDAVDRLNLTREKEGRRSVSSRQAVCRHLRSRGFRSLAFAPKQCIVLCIQRLPGSRAGVRPWLVSRSTWLVTLRS